MQFRRNQWKPLLKMRKCGYHIRKRIKKGSEQDTNLIFFFIFGWYIGWKSHCIYYSLKKIHHYVHASLITEIHFPKMAKPVPLNNLIPLYSNCLTLLIKTNTFFINHINAFIRYGNINLITRCLMTIYKESVTIKTKLSDLTCITWEKMIKRYPF